MKGLMNGASPSIDRVRDDRLELVLRPRTGGGEGLWQAQRRPIVLAMNEIAELVLERVVADRVGLADEDLGFGRQHMRGDRRCGGTHRACRRDGASPDRRACCRNRSSSGGPLVDPRHLLGHRRHHRVLVVDPGQPQNDIRDLSVFRPGSRLPRRPSISDRPSADRSAGVHRCARPG